MDAFDFVLLSYDKGLINDNDFLLVSILHLTELRFASQLLLEPAVIPTTKQKVVGCSFQYFSRLTV